MRDDTELTHPTEDMIPDSAPEPPPEIAAGMARIQHTYYDLLLSITDDIDPVTGTFRPVEDAEDVKGAGRAQEMY